MKGNPADSARLQHLIHAIAEVDVYLNNVSYEEFLQNSEKRFATIKQLEIIGEACSALKTELKASYPLVPWRAIIGFRNISIHEYFGVNFKLIWEIAKNDLSVLKEQITIILSEIME